jgi:hypothetical protein
VPVPPGQTPEKTDGQRPLNDAQVQREAAERNQDKKKLTKANQARVERENSIR